MTFFRLLFRVSEDRAYRWISHPLNMGDLVSNQNFDQNGLFPKYGNRGHKYKFFPYPYTIPKSQTSR